MKKAFSLAAIIIITASHAWTAELLVEAENLSNLGGWVVDQQSIDVMGSSYILAHGMGKRVTHASAVLRFPASGMYRMWVRTRDWVPSHPDHPGVFKIAINNQELLTQFGTQSADWAWQDGGVIEVVGRDTPIEIRDQTGFDGRCDAIFFTTDFEFIPPNSLPEMTAWRKALLGIPDEPADGGSYDVVIVGGGIAGCCAALAAARSGLDVALIHDRPVLGGNASQEIRVHTMGVVFGEIVEEVNTPGYPNGSSEAIRYDRLRHEVMENEPRMHLFLSWRAFDAHVEDNQIVSVDARHIQTGEELRFTAPLFVDSTGDGWIGYWAGAEYRMGRESRDEFGESLAPEEPDAMTMGSSVMWYSRDVGQPVSFPEVPWAMDVAKDYVATSGDWTWEYGMHLDTVLDTEEIRDHLLRAIFGSFYNAKKQSQNANRQLAWVAYIAGKRESRRLMGDHVLTEDDLRNHPDFPDTVAIGSWSIDLHYPASQKYDFQSRAEQIGIQQYGIPYRCLYSVNIDNLFMAGRCLSATHVGLGSPRVMNTCGQMGVAVGYAAYLCDKYSTLPRGVYEDHVDELRELVGFTATFEPENIVAIVDNADETGVEITGDWLNSTSNQGFYGADYIHDRDELKGEKSVRFTPDLPHAGEYEVFLRWTSSNNRATKVPVTVAHELGTTTINVNQQLNGGVWFSIGTYQLGSGMSSSVTIRNDGTNAYVIADAVCFAQPNAVALPFVDRWEIARLLGP